MDDLVNQLPCGVFLIGESDCIVMANQATGQHLGYEPAELLGKSFGQILTLASRMFCQTHFYPLIDLNGYANEVSLTLMTRTGGQIPVLLCASRELRGDSWLIRCVYIPIGQRHQYETELIQARKAAEQAQIVARASEAKYKELAAELEIRVAERTKELRIANLKLSHLNDDLRRSNENLQQFAYVASHDLQEPLRKIQSFGDIIKNQFAAELGAGLDYLERMQLAASRMSGLIKDLLTFSRISTQHQSARLVSLTQVLNDVLNDLELPIQETGAVVVADALPTILGDSSQLNQLFQNLLSNALKFRQPNQAPVIRIQVAEVAMADLPMSVKPTRLTETYHQISVSDNGIGFHEKYTDRIFQVFQRLHGKGEFPGSGIGLAICTKIAANHGGSITANSQPGQGATFILFFPIESEPNLQSATMQVENETS